jgi:predicted TIM-barrel fold metal-dependent hydrolase
MRLLATILFVCSIAVAGAGAQAAGPAAPRADHHQHLFSADVATLIARPGAAPQPLSADQLVAMLDAAGIRKALVLSVAYLYGSPARHLDDEYARVRAENDWNAAQAARYPDRLRAFCSFNPLKDYAVRELERCATTPGMGKGIKLHFGNSDVQLEDPGKLARVAAVFRAANRHRMAIVVHMRASISKQRAYGAAQARIFLEQLLPLVPDAPVQVAHFAGAGPGYDDAPSDEAMGVLAGAVARHDPRTRNLWFDVASLANGDPAPEQAARLVARIRQVGVARVLYGSDAALGGNLQPREAWAAFCRLPLGGDELSAIASNVAPWLR